MGLIDSGISMTNSNQDDWNSHWGNQDLLANFNPGQIFRHSFVKKIIDDIEKKQTILDFGSGQGDFIDLLYRNYKDSTFYGIEYSELGVELSRLRNKRAIFYKADLTLDDLSEEIKITADVITCCDVLEHIDEPLKVINNAFKMLNKGGVLILTLPGGPMTSLDFHIGHRFHYRKRDLIDLVSKSDFNEFEIKAAGWPFFNLYRLMLVLRGKKLVNDVSCSSLKQVPLRIKIVGSIFKLLFKMNLNSLNFGWQMVVILRK